MHKLYKRDNEKLYYREMWYEKENACLVRHHGEVGDEGETEVVSLSLDAEQSTETQVKTQVDSHMADFIKEGMAAGYTPFDDKDKHWLAIQIPLREAVGTHETFDFLEDVEGYVSEKLGWNGLGEMDGHDIGNGKINVFCLVVDAALAVALLQSALSPEYDEWFKHIKIATLPNDSDIDYQLKYAADGDPDFDIF